MWLSGGEKDKQKIQDFPNILRKSGTEWNKPVQKI